MKTITYNPETHVLVPREPTRFMVALGWDSAVEHGADNIDINDTAAIYRAMIAAAPQPEPVESEPVAEHELQDTRCECCGYMTYHREHMGCIRASAPQPDRTAELEQLRQRVAELEEENTALVKTIQRDARTSLRRLAALKAENEWYPIETAPKDGTEFLVIYTNQGGVMQLIRFDTIHGIWKCKGEWVPGLHATHWKPLPNPPAMAQGEK